MIQAIVSNENNGSAILSLPLERYQLASELDSIGIRKSASDICAGEGRDGISVQYSADNDLGLHLLALFPKDINLEDANHAADMVANAHPAIRQELEQHLLNDRCGAIEDLPGDIRQMIYDISGAHETYYFPLTGRIWDEECGEEFRVGKRQIMAYKNDIRERFEEYLGITGQLMDEMGNGDDKIEVVFI